MSEHVSNAVIAVFQQGKLAFSIIRRYSKGIAGTLPQHFSPLFRAGLLALETKHKERSPFIFLFHRTHFSNSGKFSDSSIPANFPAGSTVYSPLSLTSKFDHSRARCYLLRSRDRHRSSEGSPAVSRFFTAITLVTAAKILSVVDRLSHVDPRSTHGMITHEERCESEVSLAWHGTDRNTGARAGGRGRSGASVPSGPLFSLVFGASAGRAATTSAVPARMIVSVLLNATATWAQPPSHSAKFVQSRYPCPINKGTTFNSIRVRCGRGYSVNETLRFLLLYRTDNKVRCVLT